MKKIIAGFLFLAIIGMGIVIYQNYMAGLPILPNSQPQTLTEPTTPQIAITCSKKALTEVTEGPYYKTGSPQTTNLYNENLQGEKVILTGYVLDINCQPIANAWLDFWQADGNGEYDNAGYTLRGHQFTDANGKYALTTVIPGEYPGRTPHIHVKVRANDAAPIITSQLYLPDAEKNNSDAIFTDETVMDIQDSANGKTATYNFVINK